MSQSWYALRRSHVQSCHRHLCERDVPGDALQEPRMWGEYDGGQSTLQNREHLGWEYRQDPGHGMLLDVS